MDKRYGRSEKQHDTQYHTDRKTDRQSREQTKRKYPRPRPDRQFTNIDDYLKDRDAKFGKTQKKEPVSAGEKGGARGQENKKKRGEKPQNGAMIEKEHGP